MQPAATMDWGFSLNTKKEVKIVKHNLDCKDLFEAAEKKCTVCCMKLLHDFDDSNIDYMTGGRTALYHAAVYGAIDVAQLLIEKGACVNAICHGQRTPLHAAIIRQNFAMIKLLINNGADVNAIEYETKKPHCTWRQSMGNLSLPPKKLIISGECLIL